MSLRNQIRAAIFDSENTKPKHEPLTFFGQKIEIRQPDLDTILTFSNSAGDDRKHMMVSMIVMWAFVPGTDERVFEETDQDQLLKLPFGPDFAALNKAIQNLTDVTLLAQAAEKNSVTTH